MKKKSVEEIVIELSDEDDKDFPLPAEQEIDSDDELLDKEDEDLGFEDGIVTYDGFTEQQKKENEKNLNMLQIWIGRAPSPFCSLKITKD